MLIRTGLSCARASFGKVDAMSLNPGQGGGS